MLHVCGQIFEVFFDLLGGAAYVSRVRLEQLVDCDRLGPTRLFRRGSAADRHPALRERRRLAGGLRLLRGRRRRRRAAPDRAPACARLSARGLLRNGFCGLLHARRLFSRSLGLAGAARKIVFCLFFEHDFGHFGLFRLGPLEESLDVWFGGRLVVGERPEGALFEFGLFLEFLGFLDVFEFAGLVREDGLHAVDEGQSVVQREVLVHLRLADILLLLFFQDLREGRVPLA